MKVKRFNNLWAMGLILFGAILIAFYIAKIFFPEFIVGVAEIPSIVAFGNYVDSHEWAKQLFNIATVFFVAYFYFCACCRTYKLNIKQFERIESGKADEATLKELANVNAEIIKYATTDKN